MRTGSAMSPERAKILQVLKRELDFLERGGYHAPDVWRPPLIFEDSPICLRTPGSDCADLNCPLMSFVPEVHRSRVGACRHIPLNPAGETVDSLYRTGTQEELERALRSWLMATIQELEESSDCPDDNGRHECLTVEGMSS
jgi:hypothetical protein